MQRGLLERHFWRCGGLGKLCPHDLFYLAKKAKDEAKPFPRMYLWCGTEDSLLSHTERMRDCLLSLGYPLCHSLTEGNHSWPYWDEQSEKAISYFTEQ